VLDAIAKKEGITADDSELKEKIEEIATTYNDDPDRIRGLLEKQGRIPVMKEEIRIRKVIDLIVSEAKIKMVKAKQEEVKEPEKKAKSRKPAAIKEKKSETTDAPAEESKE
jgi:FKBP-type peptidyl-prolyl cis-trans isomerase (trigger factor)